MEALAGREPISAGRIHLDGKEITHQTIAERITSGMVLVPEDRQRDGLIQLMSVGRNLSLSSLPKLLRGPFVDRGRERTEVDGQVKGVRVKTAGTAAPITSLSGGNQQKVVVGRALMTQPTVLLLDEPTRGIDVGAKGEIFSLLFRAAEQGLGVLFVTSEIGEALTASHRIVVMSKGRVVEEFDPNTATRAQVMAASGESATREQPRGVSNER
jgi:erythritol transport system ATP-binding protein